MEPVTASSDRNDFSVMEQAVENGAGGRDVARELSPSFDGTIGGHQGETAFIAAHDDLQDSLLYFCLVPFAPPQYTPILVGQFLWLKMLESVSHPNLRSLYQSPYLFAGVVTL